MRVRVLLATSLATFGLACGDGDPVSPPGRLESHGDVPVEDNQLPGDEPGTSDPGGGSVDAPVNPPAPDPLPAAPWPVSGAVVFDAFDEPVLQAATDEGRNLWAVTRSALYVMRPGAGSFLRFTKADGLRDWPLLSVTGGRAGQAFVGYEGVFGPDALVDPEWMKRSGDLDRVQLRADDTLGIHHYDLHNSNTPVSGKYDETRTILSLLFVRRGALSGELYVGSSHGATRVVGDVYADHQHPATKFIGPDGTISWRYGEMYGLALDAEGRLWVMNKWKVGLLGPTTVLDDWWDPARNKWVFAGRIYPGAETDMVFGRGVAVAPDGAVYFVSHGFGMAVLPAGANPNASASPWRYPPVPDAMLTAIGADPDGTLWLGSESGLDRYDPATGSFTRYGAGRGIPGGRVSHLFVDTEVEPRALIVTVGGKVAAYRGE